MECDRMVKKKSLFVWVAFLVSTAFLSADEIRFQTTSEEMVKELTRAPVKYRSFTSKKRTIAVAQRIDNKMEKIIVVVDENLDVPKLKIKIEFDYDSSALKKSSYTLLKEVGTALVSNAVKDKIIMINGHTDSDGTQAYNLKLSFDRADSVKAWLTAAFDLPEDRLQIRGYGELLPLKPNTSPDNKQINRRVEFEIVKR